MKKKSQSTDAEMHCASCDTKTTTYTLITVWVSITLTTLIITGAMLPFSPALLTNKWIMWLLATPVQFWAGWRYYTGSWAQLKKGRANMDTLIALGTSVAYFYSVFVVLFEDYLHNAGIPTDLYFESSATIITFILLGSYLEMRAQERTSDAIQKLMNLQPTTARVLDTKSSTTQKKWIELPTEQIQIDDTILITPGSTIPVDGVVISGTSKIDQSMLTGESIPVDKTVHDTVIGGTINMDRSFQMRAEKIGSDTMLARIIKLVQQAQGSKAPVQKMVDRISAHFVPIVIILALISALFWYIFGPEPTLLHALNTLVAVLIVACPCALGLATPTSIMVGMGRAAQEGILIKDANMLELAGKMSTIVFDKTGTLTHGKQTVINFDWYLPDNSDDLERKNIINSAIVTLEKQSNHPVSTAVTNFILDTDPNTPDATITDFKSISGLGVAGSVGNNTYLIGSKKLLEMQGVTIPPTVHACTTEWSDQAQTVSFVAQNSILVAYFCVADSMRPEVPSTIAYLQNQNILCMMITGDNPRTAQAIAQQAGIPTVLSEVVSAGKEYEIQQLKKKNGIIAMVGDGINDAPALAAADIGIAMSGGTDIALESAGAALLHDDISLIPTLISLSRATMRNINQNLAWAFGYNILLIPVAMGILYPHFGITLNPMLAGASMAFSSLSVVLNALRLKRIKLT